MKITARLLVFALALMSPLVAAGQAPEAPPTLPPAAAPRPTPPERVELKVLKVFSAKDGDALFRAYVVSWKDQEVVASDSLVKTDYHVGDTITVLVMKHPYPKGQEAYGLMGFQVVPTMRQPDKERAAPAPGP